MRDARFLSRAGGAESRDAAWGKPMVCSVRRNCRVAEPRLLPKPAALIQPLCGSVSPRSAPMPMPSHTAVVRQSPRRAGRDAFGADHPGYARKAATLLLFPSNSRRRHHVLLKFWSRNKVEAVHGRCYAARQHSRAMAVAAAFCASQWLADALYRRGTGDPIVFGLRHPHRTPRHEI